MEDSVGKKQVLDSLNNLMVCTLIVARHSRNSNSITFFYRSELNSIEIHKCWNISSASTTHRSKHNETISIQLFSRWRAAKSRETGLSGEKYLVEFPQIHETQEAETLR